MMSIKNAQKIPSRYYDKPGSLKYHVRELYHGTSAFQIPSIMSQGLRPTLGAGCDALEAQFGTPVPGVYLAQSWKVAAMYPIESTTGLIPQDKTGVSGGLICLARWSSPIASSCKSPCGCQQANMA